MYQCIVCTYSPLRYLYRAFLVCVQGTAVFKLKHLWQDPFVSFVCFILTFMWSIMQYNMFKLNCLFLREWGKSPDLWRWIWIGWDKVVLNHYYQETTCQGRPCFTNVTLYKLFERLKWATGSFLIWLYFWNLRVANAGDVVKIHTSIAPWNALSHKKRKKWQRHIELRPNLRRKLKNFNS